MEDYLDVKNDKRIRIDTTHKVNRKWKEKEIEKDKRETINIKRKGKYGKENAKEKAAVLAKASDVKIGAVVSVSESAQFSIAEPRFGMIERADAMMPTEFVAGDYDVTASVQVKFKII